MKKLFLALALMTVGLVNTNINGYECLDKEMQCLNQGCAFCAISKCCEGLTCNIVGDYGRKGGVCCLGTNCSRPT